MLTVIMQGIQVYIQVYHFQVHQTWQSYELVDSFSINVEDIQIEVEAAPQIFNGTFGFGQIELSFVVNLTEPDSTTAPTEPDSTTAPTEPDSTSSGSDRSTGIRSVKSVNSDRLIGFEVVVAGIVAVVLVLVLSVGVITLCHIKSEDYSYVAKPPP